MPRLLELCSGTGSVGAVFNFAGWDVVSVDWDPKTGADVIADLLSWDYSVFPKGYFQHVHASPDCTMYSRARTKAKTPRDLDKADRLVAKCLEIIEYFGCTYTLENPSTGLLPHRPLMQPLKDAERRVTYCKYGLPYKKPTCIWTNLSTWAPRPLCCKSDACQHFDGQRHTVQAQRGQRDGSSLKQCVLFGIPWQLVQEWVDAINESQVSTLSPA